MATPSHNGEYGTRDSGTDTEETELATKSVFRHASSISLWHHPTPSGKTWQEDLLEAVSRNPDIVKRTTADAFPEDRLVVRVCRLDDPDECVTYCMQDLVSADDQHSINNIRNEYVFEKLKRSLSFDCHAERLVRLAQSSDSSLGLPTTINDNNTLATLAQLAYTQRELLVVFMIYRHAAVPPRRPQWCAKRKRPILETEGAQSSPACKRARIAAHDAMNVDEDDYDDRSQDPTPTPLPIRGVGTRLLRSAHDFSHVPLSSSVPHEQEEVAGSASIIVNPADIVCSTQYQYYLRFFQESECQSLLPWMKPQDQYEKQTRGLMADDIEEDEGATQDAYTEYASLSGREHGDAVDDGGASELIAGHVEGDTGSLIGDEDGNPELDNAELDAPGDREILKGLFESIRPRATEHMSTESWKRFCEVFCRPSEELTSGVQLNTMKIELKVHQAFLVVWAMDRASQSFGGFISDKQGLGKTITALAIAAVCAEVHMMRHTMDQFRKKGNRASIQHCRAGKKGPCPSQHIWSFRCVCAADSPTRAWDPPKGPHLVVPIQQPTLIPQWANEFDTVFRQDAVNGVRMQLLIGHKKFGKQTGPQGFNLCLTVIENAQRLIWTSSSECMTACQTVVLSTEKSFIPQVAEAVERHFKGSTIRWGSVFIDEFHLRKSSKVTLYSKILSKEHAAPEKNGPLLWAISGTPWSVDIIADLNAPLQWLSDKWEAEFGEDLPEELAECSLPSLTLAAAKVKEAHSHYQKQFLNGFDTTDAQQTLQDAAQRVSRLWSRLAMGRSPESKLPNGEPLFHLPPVVSEVFPCQVPSEHLARANEYIESVKSRMQYDLAKRRATWQQGGCKGDEPTASHGEFANLTHQARLVANLPYLAQLRKEKDYEGCKFGVDEIKDRDWAGSALTNPFRDCLDEFLASTGKFEQLRKIIKNIERTHHKHSGDSVDEALEREKLVVISEFAAVLLVVFFMIRREFPALKVGIIGGWVDVRERGQLIEAFNDVVVYNDASERVFKHNDRVDILLGTRLTIGTGTDLPRPNHLVLFEPWYRNTSVTQAQDRIRRISQKRTCYVYILKANGSSVEHMVADKAARRQFLENIMAGAREIGRFGLEKESGAE